MSHSYVSPHLLTSSSIETEQAFLGHAHKVHMVLQMFHHTMGSPDLEHATLKVVLRDLLRVIVSPFVYFAISWKLKLL